MEHTRIIEVKQNILAANDEAADAFRAARAAEGTFFVDVMASPGRRQDHAFARAHPRARAGPPASWASSRPTWNPTSTR